jgi:hypothetical protein
MKNRTRQKKKNEVSGMRTLFYNLLLISFFIYGCQETKHSSSLEKIDLVTAYKNKQIINLSDIAQSVKYVQLSSKDSLISSSERIFVDKEYIVVIAFKQQFLFDRLTGEFIREVGKKEKGPNGFNYTKYNLAYNEEKKTIYAGGWKGEVLEYTLDGYIKNTFRNHESNNMLTAFVWLNDSIYVSYVANFTGDEKSKLLFFNNNNHNNNIISTISTNDRFEKNPKLFRSWGGDKEGWFYRYNKQLFFKELFNDTIFEVNDHKLLPKYYFFSAAYKPLSERRNFISNKEMEDFYLIENIFESSKFVFFTLNFKGELRTGIYNKKKKNAIISDCENPNVFYKNKTYFGFNNDIDNFIQFCPHYMNESNEIVASVDAYEVINWFKDNPEKIAQLPQYLQKLQNIKETDNPIVMIAKLKE